MLRLFFIFTAVPFSAFAGSGDCYRIEDRDAKNYCLAITKGNASICYSIRDTDRKKLCLAETKGNRSTCYSIKDKDSRNLCLAKTRS